MALQGSWGSELDASRDAGRGKSTLGTWIRAICRAAEAAGLNSAALLDEAGVSLNMLQNPTDRCPYPQSLRLWRVATAASDDPAFGLKVASYIRNTTFHALSYGIAASSTLKEAFERTQRYCHLATDAVDYEFIRMGNEYLLEVRPATQLIDETVDAVVGTYLRMCRSLIGRDFSPLRIEFRRSAPTRLEDFHAILRAPLLFDAPCTRLVFDCDSMERPLEGGNPELARHNDTIALQYLAQLERDNIRARVQEVLTQRLARGEPSQEEIAELLGMSSRTLQRKLGERGTTYKDVLSETRHALALGYLSTPRYTVGDVTFLLGFSASSCFTRAFRRWTGQSPSAWRGSAEARRSTLGPSVHPGAQRTAANSGGASPV